jgi:hypothetical protein
MSPKTPEAGDVMRRQGNDGFFFRLWLIVVAFWTAATLIRADRVWALADGWHATLRNPLLWMELALPPLVFGSIVLAVRHIAGSGLRWSVRPPWRRH